MSDVLMPRLDGFQLCLAVREDARLAGTPVVLCSANYIEDWDRRLAERVGASAMIMRTSNLAEAIEALLDSLRRAWAPPPSGRVDLIEAERLHRVVSQLERQVSMNTGLVQRVSLQSAILSMVANLPDSVATSIDADAAPGDALGSILDAGGLSSGALYVIGPDGETQLQVQAGLAAGQGGPSEFFGQPELLAAAVSSEQGIVIPSPAIPQATADAFLGRAGMGAAIIVPLTSRGERLGALLLASGRRDLAHHDWLAFARSIASQLSQTIALSRAFSRLTTSERRYRGLFDQIPVGLFRERRDGRILAANPAMVQMMGYPDDAALCRINAADLYADPADRGRLEAEAEAAGTVRGFETRLRRRDGTLIWTRMNLRATRDDDGETVYEGSIEDITRARRDDQRRAAAHGVSQALAESPTVAEALPRILEAVCRSLEWDVGEFWLPDAAGVLQNVHVWHGPSSEMESFAATSRDLHFESGVGLPGQTWASGAPCWMPDLGADRSFSRTEPAARAGLHAGFGFPISVGEEVLGVMTFLSRSMPEPDEALFRTVANIGNQVGQFMERRRAQQALERQRESLTQTEKLAAMGQLLAGVAHELNNPLSVVLGQAALLRNLAGTGPLQARAEKIARSADRCARIVKNFLALARQRPPERKRVDVNAVAREAVELLAYGLRVDTVEVVFDLAAVPAIWGDPHQLHQVVVNLVTNAHHALRGIATPRRITIASRSDEAGGSVVLTVSDNGPGVAAGIRARIFEPFFTTKAPGEGTGLGLSLCHGIVESHAGTISVDNSPGGGAAFRIVLPVRMPPETVDAAIEAPRQPLARKRILVVDDEQEVAVVLAELLTMDGHDVDTAPNGRIALEKLRQRVFDLVLSDVRMPELDGPGLYREIERRHPQLKDRFVLVTGDMLSATSRDFLSRTTLPSVSKPVDFGEVLRIVQQIFRRA